MNLQLVAIDTSTQYSYYAQCCQVPKNVWKYFLIEISKVYYKYHIIYIRHSPIPMLYAYMKDSFYFN
jgi:hypothetical protein